MLSVKNLLFKLLFKYNIIKKNTYTRYKCNAGPYFTGLSRTQTLITNGMIDVRVSNNTRSPIRSKVIQVSRFRSQHRKFVIKYPFLYIHFFSLCPVYPKASLRFKLRFFQTDNFLTSSSSISSLLLLIMYIV